MKGTVNIYYGIVIVAISYWFFGLLYGSSFFEEINNSIIIEYGILLVLSMISCRLMKRSGQNTWTKWLTISTIPGLLFMTYMRFHESTGGWIRFPWDWGLWEFFIPIIYGIMQVLFIITLTLKRRARARASRTSLK